MLHEEQIRATVPMLVKARIRDYAQLMKPNLSFLVVFSSVIGYLLAPGIQFIWKDVVLLFTGGVLVTGGANTINQILERNSDKFMTRTRVRPLPEGRMHASEAWIVAILSGALGVGLLSVFFNPLAGLLSFISLLLYAFAYTPLKKISSVAVFVGAIPGALPPLIGWVAATGQIGVEAWALFLIQFFWQFPHFWAIAWVSFEDYERAGIRMLPSREGRTRFTGLQCMFYSVVLIPLAIVPRMLQISGNTGMFICMALGVLYFAASAIFFIRNDHKSAKRVMFASFIYLPIALLALLIDKI